MPRLFHFQYLGAAGWECVGAGIGEGREPIAEALEEVRRLSGGRLPAGHYQAIEARAADPRFESFELGEDGKPVMDRPALRPAPRLRIGRSAQLKSPRRGAGRYASP
ncbi:MAG: hypothetical protein BGO11_17865 [Solirubrobacterales bacterium 70-9]|nr:MAG: hypothetical protein BGO11_17865 [Solirubrobacterales bacterium 70-9]